MLAQNYFKMQISNLDVLAKSDKLSQAKVKESDHQMI